MKKLALLLLCLTIVFSLAACGKDSEPSAPDHNYISTVVAPTCNSVGYTEHVCQDCGKSYKDNEVSATGNHSFYDLYVMESTCVSRKVLRTCSVCNIVAVIDEEPIAEHNFLDRVCTVCGELGPSEGLEFTLNSDENSYSVSGMGTCTDTDIIIPSIYNNLPVTSIGDEAFRNCDSLTTVTFEENSQLTTIGSYAFEYCDSLISITIPSSVTTIGDEAFRNCLSLTNITIPSSVTTIGNRAFGNCDSLMSITIPSGVTSIDRNAFSHCDSLTSIIIPSSVTSIGDEAFRNCDSLTSITVDINNKYYKDVDGNLYTKDGKTLIQYAIGKKDASFIIPDGVASICNYAFSHCDSLTAITIPSSVTSINNSAFSHCDTLTAVIFEENSKLTTIYNYAFSGCDSLTSITIPSSVTSISNYAFSGCDSLTNITVDVNNKYYKDIDGNLYTKDGKTLIQYAICKKDASFIIPDGVTTIGDEAFAYCDSLTNITIPNSVTTIGDWAFSNCDSLTCITIPSSVTSIGSSAFSDCYSLTNVRFEENIQLTSIGNYAFSNCDSLTGITLPSSVTTIGNGAFAHCDSLNTVIFEENSKLTTIGDDAFAYCDSLTGITIPSSVTTIGSSAFYNCYSLKTVYYTGTKSEWNTISIGSSNSKLTNATRYYYSKTAPTTEGNYWHYVDGEIVVW